MSTTPRPTAWWERGRTVQVLTFWLRPAFALRVLGRFQRIAGFDRAVALASSALTGLIPLAIVTSALVEHFGGRDLATRIIDRYGLSGAGADAVRDVFKPTGGTSASLSLLGVLLLIVAILSFSRAMQRLFEQTWELKALSVRNSVNGLLWAIGSALYMALSGLIHVVLGRGRLDVGASIVVAPLTAAFLMWSGRLLSGRRLSWQDLLPFGIIGGLISAVYSIGAAVYVPHLFDSYAARYGAIGAVFAMIATLISIMVILVGSAALGREVVDELRRIRSGQRPPDDEVRQEWDKIIAEARSRYASAREQLGRLRHRG